MLIKHVQLGENKLYIVYHMLAHVEDGFKMILHCSR